MTMTLKQIKFDEDDLKAVEMVRQRYGCDSFSQAVRLAAHVVASSQRVVAFLLPPSPKFSNVRREFGSLEGLVQLPNGVDADQLDKLLAEVANGYRFSWREPTQSAPRRRRPRASIKAHRRTS